MQADEAIVLAGGFGTRLRSVVSDVPKPLAPVAGRPFLAWLLDELAQQGLRRVVLATGHMADKVEAAIGVQWAGMEIAYSVESNPLGTGGALKQALTQLQGQCVHVLNGDTFLRYSLCGLEDAASNARTPAAVALAWVDDASRYGAVEVTDGRVTAFREKGGQGAGWINAGSYFFTAAALDALPADEVFSLETQYLHPQAANGTLAAFTESSGFIDIGVPEDYQRAQTLFRKS
jgi:D-glycero-alpha-D-manno-heptose 1-phosphate guanylyltransferase